MKRHAEYLVKYPKSFSNDLEKVLRLLSREASQMGHVMYTLYNGIPIVAYPGDYWDSLFIQYLTKARNELEGYYTSAKCNKDVYVAMKEQGKPCELLPEIIAITRCALEKELCSRYRSFGSYLIEKIYGIVLLSTPIFNVKHIVKVKLEKRIENLSDSLSAYSQKAEGVFVHFIPGLIKWEEQQEQQEHRSSV